MVTKAELKEKAINYIEVTYPNLIKEITTAMDKAASTGHLCLYRYSTENEDEARSMERYFKAKGFDAESSWTSHVPGTEKFEGWYVSIFWS